MSLAAADGLDVLLPYRFTLFSNYNNTVYGANCVLLPYRFTLFSNCKRYDLIENFVLLPYRFTLFSNQLKI